MQYRTLGRSGLQVSVLSLGSWLTFGKQINDSTCDELMSIAYESGINFFDNAETYAKGKSEEVMGKILAAKKWERSTYLVSSKVYFGYQENKPNQRGLSRKHIIEGCEAALKRLQVEYIDLFFCHRPDKQTPIGETVAAMDTLMRQGKILYWGTSEWSGVEILQAHLEAERQNCQPPLMEQPQYNMFERHKMELEYLHLFKYQGMGTTTWSPLASGVLSGKYNLSDPGDTRLSMKGLEWLRDKQLKEERIDKVRKLQVFADEMEVSLPELAIAWCLNNPNVSTVILGASKPQQLQQNLGALKALELLTVSIMQRIDDILQNKPVQPEY